MHNLKSLDFSLPGSLGVVFASGLFPHVKGWASICGTPFGEERSKVLERFDVGRKLHQPCELGKLSSL